MHCLHLAGRGRESRRVLRIDAALDGMWPRSDVVLRIGKVRTGRDPQLLLHKIEPVERFRHRMLDLQACVHLDEEELAVLIEELDGAHAFVAELLHGARHAAADLVTLRGIEGGECASSQIFWWRRCSEQSRSPR